MNRSSNTPLLLVVERGHTGVVERLLEKGASIEVINKHSNTALDLATLFNHTDIVKLLKNKAAELVIHGNST